MYWGGVAALALLAFSLIAASCSNNSDSDGGSPSPTLPATVGDNPIKAETKLGSFHTGNSSTGKEIYISNDIFLVMNPNGTAEYHDYGDLEYVFKYTWDTEKQEIYMVVEKIPYDDGTLLNYNQYLSKLTIDELKKLEKEEYEKYKDEDWFKKEYPNCKSYEDYEKLMLAEYGYKNFDEYFKEWKEYELKWFKELFGAKMTYGYDFDKDDKMVLTEKFTGVKNFLLSSCNYYKDNTEVYIDSLYSGKGVRIQRYVDGKREDWDGELGNGKTITFEEYDLEETKTGSYSEDIANETVTVNFDGESYVCKFEGRNFIEVDE